MKEEAVKNKEGASLIKYTPENNYISTDYRPLKGPPANMCGQCKSYYSKLYTSGLTKTPFPPQCNGHVLDSVGLIKSGDFDTEEEYDMYLTASDPSLWALRYLNWEARWYQEQVMSCTSTRVLCRWGRRTGKCLAKGTMVATPNGPVAIENMRPGDTVYDENAKEIKVTGVFDQGIKEVVDLKNNGYIVATCTLDHKWLTEHYRIKRDKVRRLKDFYSSVKIKRNLKYLNKKQDKKSNLISGVSVVASDPRMEQCYDLEVNSKTHLYTLANGLITHNTIALVVKILWLLSTNSDYSVLVVAPYEAQVRKIFDEIDKFIQASPEIQGTVRRSTKSPCRMELMNGSKALGFSSGSKSAARSDKIRGQDAHYIALDEMDYLDEADVDAILAILASHPNCGLWASSTPTGMHRKFYQFAVQKDLGFKEYWYISPEAPNWTPEVEQFLRESTVSTQYDHEYLAIFGIQESGVFRNDLVDASLRDYSLPISKTENSTVCIGVDWNGQSIGTHIIVTECVSNTSGDVQYIPLEKRIIKGTEFTQHDAVEEIIKLNEKYSPAFIYVDAGYGATQIEMLHKYGKANRGSGLHKKVIPYSMGSSIEITDPITKQVIKKHAKPFLVNLCVLQLEQMRVVLPVSEDTQVLVETTENKESGHSSGIVQQMRNFAIERVSITGLPTYSQGEDHGLTAWMLSVAAFVIELSDMKGSYKIQLPVATRSLDMPKESHEGYPTKQGTMLAEASRSIALSADSKKLDPRDAYRQYAKERNKIARGDRTATKKYFGKKSIDRTSSLRPKGWGSRRGGGRSGF